MHIYSRGRHKRKGDYGNTDPVKTLQEQKITSKNIGLLETIVGTVAEPKTEFPLSDEERNELEQWVVLSKIKLTEDDLHEHIETIKNHREDMSEESTVIVEDEYETNSDEENPKKKLRLTYCEKVPTSRSSENEIS